MPGHTAHHEWTPDHRLHREQTSHRPEPVGQAFGNHDVTGGQRRKEQQTQRAFPALAAEAVRHQQRNQGPDRQRQGAA